MLAAAWNATWDGSVLTLAPVLALDETILDARRVRFGRTILDLALRRRQGRIVLKIARRFGPSLPVRASWGGPEPVDAVLIDENPMGRQPVSFQVEAEHEVQFLAADS